MNSARLPNRTKAGAAPPGDGNVKGNKHAHPIELDADEAQLSRFTAEIGETDERAGAAPLLRAGSMILSDRDEDGNLLDVELLVSRRPTPIR